MWSSEGARIRGKIFGKKVPKTVKILPGFCRYFSNNPKIRWKKVSKSDLSYINFKSEAYLLGRNCRKRQLFSNLFSAHPIGPSSP